MDHLVLVTQLEKVNHKKTTNMNLKVPRGTVTVHHSIKPADQTKHILLKKKKEWSGKSDNSKESAEYWSECV